MKINKLKIFAFIFAIVYSIGISKLEISISSKRRKPTTPILKHFVIPPIELKLSTTPQLSNSTKTINININTENEITKVVWASKLYDTPDELLSTIPQSNAIKVTNTQWTFEITENGTYTVAIQDNTSNKGVANLYISEFDRVPPPMITDFYGNVSESKINLSWKNPKYDEYSFYDSPFEHVEISYQSVRDVTNGNKNSTTKNSTYTEPVIIPNKEEHFAISNIDSNAVFYNVKVTVFDEVGNNQSSYFRVYVDDKKQLHVGDVILQDGSIIPFEKNYTYTEMQKQNAIAVITGYRNGIPLGLGLHQSSSDLQWTSGIENGYNTMFDTTICTPMLNGYIAFYEQWNEELYFEGDVDGSNNWDEICKSDEIETSNPEMNYPAFNFALNYGKTFDITGDYESDWFLPSIAELVEVYKNKEIIDIVLEKLNMQSIRNSYYWTSSQYYSLFNNPVTFDFAEGFASFYTKYGSYYVCVMREF